MIHTQNLDCPVFFYTYASRGTIMLQPSAPSSLWPATKVRDESGRRRRFLVWRRTRMSFVFVFNVRPSERLSATRKWRRKTSFTQRLACTAEVGLDVSSLAATGRGDRILIAILGQIKAGNTNVNRYTTWIRGHRIHEARIQVMKSSDHSKALSLLFVSFLWSSIFFGEQTFFFARSISVKTNVFWPGEHAVMLSAISRATQL